MATLCAQLASVVEQVPREEVELVELQNTNYRGVGGNSAAYK